MKKKELLKQLIAGFQAGLPVEVYPRELMLPVDSNKIITVPGVRRCGKSSFILIGNQSIDFGERHPEGTNTFSEFR